MTQQRSAMLESFMQRFSAALGACSGLLIGISKEGVDLLSSLRSAQGWKEIYTGTSPARSKKIDNGNVASAFSRQPPKSGIALTPSIRITRKKRHVLVLTRCSTRVVNASDVQGKTRSSNFWAQGLLSSKARHLLKHTLTPRSWVARQLHQCRHQRQ